MNYILIGIGVAGILLAVYSSRIYSWGYRNGQTTRPATYDEELEAARQKVRLLQYKLTSHDPQVGDECIVLDYASHPPIAQPAQVVEYNTQTAEVYFKRYGDTYPLTGKLYNGIIVMLDYAQEC